jgi:hypothetical protein
MYAPLRHPFGLSLLAVSAMLAVAAHLLPLPQRLEDFAPWILVWGAVAYAGTAFALKMVRPVPSAPELRELYYVRQFMARELSKQKARSGNEVAQLTRVLSEAIRHLDRQVAPELQRLLERHCELNGSLARYSSGQLPLPEPEVYERLQRIHSRQRAAIDECVQQASNAAGTLVALLQEGDDAMVAAEAQKWAQDLLTLYDAIADVLRGEGREDEPASRALTAAPVSSRSLDGNGDDQTGNGFRQLVEEALRQLDNTSALAQCELVSRLPGTIATVRARSGDGTLAEPTPLEQVQALRQAIETSIELMNPGGSNGRSTGPEAIQYHILKQQYVLRKPTRHIMTRYSIAESTYHRYRRDAVSVLASHLEAQEEQLHREIT